MPKMIMSPAYPRRPGPNPNTAREVLDYVAFWELWNEQRSRFATEAAFFVGMLGYRWGRQASAQRFAARSRWFHQDAAR